jgi:hypothetical protein
MLLVDVINGFTNKLPGDALDHLAQVCNCYRHSAQPILRWKGHPDYTLLSKEGVTQGNPLSMVFYGLTLVPLAATLQRSTRLLSRHGMPTTWSSRGGRQGWQRPWPSYSA